jgi:uncharacterized membrane protein YsdA (DUF1294 family)
MVYRYGLTTVFVALGITFLLKSQFPLDFWVAWLIAFSAVAFLTYGYDKQISGTDRMRVPEKVLLLLAFLGGTPGALVGMQVFRHKTTKQSFQQQFWLVVLLQIVFIVAILVVMQRLKTT